MIQFTITMSDDIQVTYQLLNGSLIKTRMLECTTLHTDMDIAIEIISLQREIVECEWRKKFSYLTDIAVAIARLRMLMSQVEDFYI